VNHARGAIVKGRVVVEALQQAGWAPATVFALHVLASRVLDLYRIYPPSDIPMHLLGGVAIAFFIWRGGDLAARAGLIGAINRAGLAVMTFGLTCAAAVFWEFAEYASDRYFGTTAQAGLADTLKDMLMGIAGGLAFLTVTLIAARLRAARRAQ